MFIYLYGLHQTENYVFIKILLNLVVNIYIRFERSFNFYE